MSNYKNSKSSIALPFIVSIALAGGILIGANSATPSKYSNDVNKSLLKFREIVNHINTRYVDTVNTEELVDIAIEKMLDELDPHTNYMSGDELEIARSNLKGGFEGVGIEFSIIKDTLRVVLPIVGGPSAKAGLLSGDKIVKINDEIITGIGLNNKGVFERLRGKKGTKVSLGVIRLDNDVVTDYEIVRDKIPQKSVDIAYMIDDTTGYLKISRFSSNTYEEFQTALTKLIEDGMKQLMLDLTDNPGGYLDKAVSIVDEFIAGDSMIVYTEGKKKSYNNNHRAHREGAFEKGALVVLIDEGSASASEIVSGALQDNDRAIIVGRRSFGKGLVQMPIDLSDGSELRLTISRYFTPSGRSIQKPYHKGDHSNYGKDLSDRFKNGELFNKDSIKNDDSKKYKTANGRIVYGGGGITPDYFVPIDTNKFISSMFRSSTIKEFVINYYAKNKKKIDKMGEEKFEADFKFSKQYLKELKTLALNNDLKVNDTIFLDNKDELMSHLKARLARIAFGNKSYYPLYNRSNKLFQTGLSLFEEANKLSKDY